VGCAKPSECYELNVIPYDSISAEHATESAPEQPTFKPDAELTEMLSKKLSFTYPYAKLSRVPSKISVSRLYPGVLDENDTSLELFAEDSKARIPDFFLSTDKSEKNAAERGTATHLFMQFCDFHRIVEYGIENEIARLVSKKFLPENAAELIYAEELDRFLESDLIQRILGARTVIREQRFNIELMPDGFTENDGLLEALEGERLAVQGVIDLILIDEDGNVELYDYKTDRLSRDALASDSIATKKMTEKHGQQLFYYSKAIEFLMGKTCSRTAIYSTHSAKLYDIDVSGFNSGTLSII
jgi:ATP-dependent exoDNAse (exonuclease V) beta subunit